MMPAASPSSDDLLALFGNPCPSRARIGKGESFHATGEEERGQLFCDQSPRGEAMAFGKGVRGRARPHPGEGAFWAPDVAMAEKAC